VVASPDKIQAITSRPIFPQRRRADRTFFLSILAGKYAMVLRPAVLYRIRRSNVIWKFMKDKVVF